MRRMIVETFDSPFAVKKRLSYPNAGGHASVRDLQASILRSRRPAKQNHAFIVQPVRVEKLPSGVLIHKRNDADNQWHPYQKVTLEHHPF